jgi:ligand-binding sensor domain-containing protein
MHSDFGLFGIFVSDSRTLRYIYFVIFLWVSQFMCAQSGELTLRRFSTSDGLSDNNVRCMLVDSKGFVWLGTDDGLNRFDGLEFVTIRRHGGTSFSLSGNIVTDVKEDADGTLWIGTRDGGVCQLNTKTGEVFHPKLISSNGAEQRYVNCVFLDGPETLYVATDKGVFVSHDRRNFKPIAPANSYSCYDIARYNNQIIAAVNMFSLGAIVGDSLTYLNYHPSYRVPYPAHSLNDLFVDGANTLWAGAWDNQLHKFDVSSNSFEHIQILHEEEISYTDDEVVSIHETSLGVLWLGMKSSRVLAYNILSGETYPIQFSSRESGKLNGHRIHFIFTDDEQRTWIGTDNGLHLYHVTSSNFMVYPLPEAASVTSFTELGERIYATSTSGLYAIEDGRVIKVSDQPTQAYSSMANGEMLLIGTNKAIKQFDPKGGTLDYWTEQQNIVFDVNEILSSRYSSLRKITHSGKNYLMAIPFGHGVVLSDLNSKRWALCDVRTQLGIENLIRNFYQDRQGRLWILGSNYGLTEANSFYYLEQNNPVELDDMLGWDNLSYNINGNCYSKGLLSKELTALVEREDGRFWITTQGAGLYSYDPNNAEAGFISIPSPLQSMQNMVADEKGNLWIVASGGLLQYDVHYNTWRRFDHSDGLPISGLSYAMYVDKNKRFYLGGNESIVSFDPNQVITGAEQPKTRLTHITVMDQPVDTLLAMESFELDHDKNFISFSFTGLCFSDPKAVIYDYRLEGVDEQWRSNGNDNKVSYSNLSPGEYVFRVRARNLNGTDSKEEASIRFVVLRPFYLQWWFLLSVCLVFLIGTFLIVRYIQNQNQKIATVRTKIARDLHDDIGSALGSISFFSETAIRTIHEQDQTNTKSILEKIGHTSREMIGNMHDIVWAVNSHNDGVQNMIDRMKTYAADMVASSDVQLYFEGHGDWSNSKISMTERKNIFLVFKEAIYNSHKYSGCKAIHIRLDKPVNSRMHFIIEDDGNGFDLEQKLTTGNGLRNIRVRLDEIGARHSLQTAEGKGTRLEIWL